MSKKQERINLVGVYNVINNAESNPTGTTLTYKTEDIQSPL